MRALWRALSWSYLRRHPLQVALTVAGVAVGVATFTSVRVAQATLVGGLAGTIDRLAGRAHIQITGLGGVPEELLESVRTVEGVQAVAPAIEQLVTVRGTPAGALLMLGIDLLADSRIRDHGFDGGDADLDDPLVFLAQPDSVAVSATWADRAGVNVGDTIDVEAGATRRRMVVRARLGAEGFAAAFGGNVAITDVYAAQELFGRGRRFDRIDVRLHDEAGIAASLVRLRGAAAGYNVDTPARRSADLSRLIGAFVGSFDVSSGLAILVGVFLITNVLRVSVDRRRHPLGIVRAIGATPRQVRAALLYEAAALGLIGGALGATLGWLLTHRILALMGSAVQTAYGASNSSHATVTPALVMGAAAVGVGAALVGAWLPGRLASRVDVVSALAAGTYRRRAPVARRRQLLAGVGLLVAPAALAAVTALESRELLAASVVCGALATLLLTGPIAAVLIRAASPLVRRLAPVAGRLANDSLQGQPRRTAATTAAVAISLALVLGTGGYLHSFRVAFDRWLDSVMTSDLYVRASADLAPSLHRLPAGLQDQLRAVPGVGSADAYRLDWITVRGESAVIASFDGEGFAERTRHRFIEGDHTTYIRDVVHGGQAAVSENLARRHGLRRGDHLDLDTPAGPLRIAIAAVVDSYLSDRGLIMIERQVFLTHWRDTAVNAYHVTVAAGADAETVRQSIFSALRGEPPALVTTREEFRTQAAGALDGFYSLTRVTVGLMLAVALIGIVTSLLSSVVDRRAELGLLKALGATASQVRRSVMAEALLTAGAGLAVAIPLGALLAQFLETVVADHYAGFVIPGTYPVALLFGLAVALPGLSLVAAWLPAEHAVRTAASETMRP